MGTSPLNPITNYQLAILQTRRINMCFSATASFAASALLIPIGVYCIKTALAKDTDYLPLAFTPLAFGIQQALEGVVWLGINSNNFHDVDIGSVGFLFFSHWFWLFWMPFLVWAGDRHQKIKQVCAIFAMLGFVYGALLYLPLIANSNWLEIDASSCSIAYRTKLIFDFPMYREVASIIYALIVGVPLLIASNGNINTFGALILVSMLFSQIVFYYAFISVWCFFAALLSIYILYILEREVKPVSGNMLAMEQE
jgi:hypothetical protein